MGLNLGYGLGFVKFEPPENFQILMPEELPAADGSEIERAMDESLGQDLADYGGRGRSASILVSDITRPSPSHIMLAPLAKKLKELGFFLLELTLIQLHVLLVR